MGKGGDNWGKRGGKSARRPAPSALTYSHKRMCSVNLVWLMRKHGVFLGGPFVGEGGSSNRNGYS